MRRKTQGRSDYPFGNQPDRQGLVYLVLLVKNQTDQIDGTDQTD